ncbi:hypothetical protein C8R47DRAFT_1129696 [Mycena vitilis]|nr:hypothetical protein C8R47DRAFT_1129696 [Mycena vitilis]
MDLSTEKQRNRAIELDTEDLKTFDDDPPQILFKTLQIYDYPGYSIDDCAGYLDTFPHLYRLLVKAHDPAHKSYKPLVDAVLQLPPSASGAVPANTSSLRPESSDPVALPSDEPAFTPLPRAVHDTVGPILPSLRKIVEPDWTWPSLWKPTNISASESPEIHAWLSDLKIPMVNEQPSLLLHRLGKLGDLKMFSRLRKIFQVNRATVFVNTSGSGKTRHLFEGLSRKWGFYFTTSDRYDKLGSRDLMNCIDGRLLSSPGFTDPLPTNNFSAALQKNRTIARNCITQVLLARFIVFHAFINAIITSGRKITEDDKLRWLYVQLDPVLLLGRDVFHLVARALNDQKFSGPMCEQWIQQFQTDLPALINSHFAEREPLQHGTKAPQSLQPEAAQHMFHIVLDEAQFAATLLDSAFRSASGTHWRSVLREVIVALFRAMANGTAFTIGGTGIDKNLIEELMDSVVAKSSDIDRVSDTGSFDPTNAVYQKTYIRRYLPVSIQQTAIGRRLMQRIINWLAGRFRFTASFLADLLDSDFQNPHQFLNDWVEFNTGFRPTDASDITQPFCVTAQFPTRKVIESINFIKIRSVQGLAQVLTDAVYESLLRSGTTSSLSEGVHNLVEYGFARYTTANCTSACISEPLVLLATTYYVNEHHPGQNPFGQTMWQYVVQSIGKFTGSRYNGFETYLAFLLADALATPVPLKDVFDFTFPAPEWANQSARLVALSKDPKENTPEGEPPAPSQQRRTQYFNWREHAVPAGRIGETCDVKRTLQWLRHGRQAPFCFPDNNMGPDILFVLELANKKLIWVALQAKFLANPIDNGPLKDAIRTTVPHKYFVQKSGEHFSKAMRPELIEETHEALTLAGGENTGNTYPLLRVVVVSPPTVGIDQLDAHIDDKAATLSDGDNHHDPGGHPLVALNWQRLLETTADRKERFLKVLTNPVERDPNKKRLPVKSEKKIKPAVEWKNGSKPVGEEKRKSSREEESVKKRRKTGPSNSTSTDVGLTQAKKNKSRSEGVGTDVGSLPDKNTSNSSRGKNKTRKTSKNDRDKSRDTSAYDSRGAQRGRQMGAGPGDAGPSRLFDHTRSASSSSPMRVDRDNLRARSSSRPQSSMRPSTPGALGRGRDWEKDRSPRSVSAASSPPASRATTRTPGPAVRRPFSPYSATEDEMGDSGSRKAELSSRLRR